MSAIAGIIHWGGHPVQDSLLLDMLATVPYRGQDGVHIWTQGLVGLGCRLMACTPRSVGEKIPLVENGCALALDGRLDNRAELTTSLGTSPDTPDDQLTLAAYFKWGDSFVRHLIGDFALALWDGPRQRLVCARSPMGVKPLYYRSAPQGFLVASEIRQLFAYPGVPCRLNQVRAVLFLLAHDNQAQETLYQGISRLPAAHMLVATHGKVELHRYWDVDPSRQVMYPKEEDYIAHFNELFTKAVADRCRSSGPVAVMVSGGLDSSSVACVALKLARQGLIPPVVLVSARFRDLPKMEESQYVQDMASMYHTQAHFVDGNDLWTLKPEASQSTAGKDEPFMASYEAVIRRVLAKAREEGARVILTGQGGDEVFTAGLWHLLDLLRGCKIGQFRREASYLTPAGRRYIYMQFLRSLVPSPLYTLVERAQGTRRFPPWLKADSAMRSELARKIEASLPPRRYRNHYYQGCWDMAQTMGDTHWLTWSERVGQEYGMEVRHPFLDIRLADFLFRVPPQQKYHAGVRKLLLRRAMHGTLPESIRQRRDKANFHALFDLGMGEKEAPRLEKMIDSSLLARLGMMDQDKLAEAFQKYQQGDRRWRRELFLTFTLEEWLRERLQGIDGEGVALAPPNANRPRKEGGYAAEARVHPAKAG